MRFVECAEGVGSRRIPRKDVPVGRTAVQREILYIFCKKAIIVNFNFQFSIIKREYSVIYTSICFSRMPLLR